MPQSMQITRQPNRYSLETDRISNELVSYDQMLWPHKFGLDVEGCECV